MIEITQENIEKLLCTQLPECATGNFEFYFDIVKAQLTSMLGYDIFALQESGGSIQLEYEPESEILRLPPFSSINSIEQVSCDHTEDINNGCTFIPVTSHMVYTAECYERLQHCPDGCGCKINFCGCKSCLRIEINAEWCIPTDFLIAITELMRGNCGANVRSKSIEGMSVTYFEQKSIESTLANFISRYSIGGIHVS